MQTKTSIKRLIIYIIFGILTTIYVFIACFIGYLYFFIGKKENIILAENVTITSNWYQIIPDDPLTSKNHNNWLCIKSKSKFWYDSSMEKIRDNRNTELIIIGEIVSREGKIYPLGYPGFMSSLPSICLWPPELPRNEEYVRVRIKSNIPIKAEKITWYDTDKW